MNKCPNCNSSQAIIEGELTVKIGYHATNVFCCLKCGLCFGETYSFDKPRQHSEINIGRLVFMAPDPKRKEQIAELKAVDRALYCGWLEILGSIEKTAIEQLNSKRFSKYACHFLYLIQILIDQLRQILKIRIGQIDMYFKGRADAGS